MILNKWQKQKWDSILLLMEINMKEFKNKCILFDRVWFYIQFRIG